MVDFQSRDTNRGRDDEDGAEDTPEEDGSTEDDPTAEEPAVDDAAAEEQTADEQEPQRGVAVVSVTADHTIEDDEAGDAVVEEIERADGEVVTREVLQPSFDGVQQNVDALVDRRDVYAVVTTGGTGVEPDDVTVKAVRQMLDKELPGFGELFRRTCYESVGSAAIRTRATAGVMEGVACFCLPGEADLARQGTRDYVVPEAEHLATLADEPESED